MVGRVNHERRSKRADLPRIAYAHFCLTADGSLGEGRADGHKSPAGRDRGHRLHRQPSTPTRSRAAGGDRGRGRRLHARAVARGGRAASAPRRRYDERRGARRRRGRRRRPRLHPQPPARGPRRARRWRPASTSSARSRSPSTSTAPSASRRSPPAAAAWRRGAVRVPLLPHGARGAAPDRLGHERRRAPRPRHLPPGLAARAPRTTTGASTPTRGGASRAFADIGSHWCDLAEFVTGHRLTRLSARTTTAVPERSAATTARRSRAATATARCARSPPRTPSWCSSRPTAARSARPSSARSPPAARTGSGSRSTPPGRRSRFDQEDAESLWVGRRDESVDRARATRRRCRRAAARLAVLPAGHPQGYQDCFNLFVADVFAAIETGDRARRAAGASPTGCGPSRSPTPC